METLETWNSLRSHGTLPRVKDPSNKFLSLTLVILVAAAMFAIRLAGPSNLMDNDQERPASYVLDAVLNGHWACQVDWMGDVASKPPLYTWLAGLATLPFDRISLFTLYLPAALSVAGMACLILLAGRKYFGPTAGLLGALAFLLSPMMSRQVALARTDALFAFMISLAALAAFRAWTRGRGWTRFWLLAALATLAKGPLGIPLAAGGLMACVWEKKTVRGSHLFGLALYGLIAFGWFALAYQEMGQVVIDKMLKREMLFHAMTDETGDAIGQNFYKPAIYFLHRFLPWSLPACAGFWRVLKRPAISEPDRQFERFLSAWFFVGLVVFSIAPHQRGDLLAPIVPPAALLAGREIALLLKRFRQDGVVLGTAVFALAALGVTARHYFKMAEETIVQKTLGMEQLARSLDGVPMIHVDTPFTLQFYLNTMQVIAPPEKAGELLSGTNAVVVALCDFNRVQPWIQEGVEIYELARWPETGEPFVRIISNRR
jgi:4-amino-4-deoxy-L-arabinose transferase-like glycosyltransferase